MARTSSGAALAKPTIILLGKLSLTDASKLPVFAKLRFNMSAKSGALTSQFS